MINNPHRLYLLFFLLQAGLLYQQNPNYKPADLKAKSVTTFKSAKDLSVKLTSGLTTDLLKTRAIFFWITENIKYDTKEYHCDSAQSYYTRIRSTLNIDNQKRYDSAYNARILDTVLKRKAGICDGYARLFKTLCNEANIKSELVVGMGKNKLEAMDTYDSNHAWNCVFIADQWLLVDACWGAGYCDTGITKFTRERDDFYFLTPPKKFAMSHFPDSQGHFHYMGAITKSAFLSLPIVYSDFFKMGFDNFSPLNGLIQAKKNDKVSVNLTRPYEEKTEQFSGSDSLYLKKSEVKFYLEQKIENPDAGEMYIYYNHKAILLYKLQAR